MSKENDVDTVIFDDELTPARKGVVDGPKVMSAPRSSTPGFSHSAFIYGLRM